MAFENFATRFPDNIARLAALFHVFCGCEGEITLDTLKRAASIFYWYLEEAIRLFDRNQVREPEEVQHANLLLPWLKNRFNTKGEPISKNYIYQNGPNQVRLKRKLDPALNYLASCGQISRLKEGKKTYITPGPNMFPQPVQHQSTYPQYHLAAYGPNNC